MSKSWNIPGFDVYDPSLVFYAPLWRPDMVARGGSIKDGTGTMDVNPQALAVGSNTITVTASGTLIVAMPEGGTVASGTMTVTGSPVTVSAGIQTTITTTGAIGNITVTPNNIIRSKDRNNRALTVTGATWGYQGRTFNGTNDFISVGSNTNLDNVNTFSWEIWIKPTTINTDHWVAAKRHLKNYNIDSAGALAARHEPPGGGTAASSRSATDLVAVNNSYHIVFTYNDTGDRKIYIYINGAEVSYLSQVAAIGALPDDSAYNWRLGHYVDSLSYFSGLYGEALFYNRVLTLSEIQQIYLATRFRYA